ncbi:hypothetical protein H9X96_22210 [Pedobacter sp. N36a]|uniref:Arm DNA-binding domain-containing protein n=1 Tax=Pedobacter sp. N36a TaxID=2767996 RepID=UPI001656A0EC|nr:Arm DNA-binding domain-containing protein [Pedobacter sp. N36a]MBC8988472.1 hypothetical protein [Pedobacter sp. N36a]
MLKLPSPQEFRLIQKKHSSGDAPIYLRITVEGNRVEITTGQECKPDRWNPKTGRLTGTKEDIKRFNAYLDNIQAMVYRATKN